MLGVMEGRPPGPAVRGALLSGLQELSRVPCGARPLTPALPSPQVSGEALSWSPLPLEGPAASMANDPPLRGRAPDSHNQGPTVIPRPPS